ncbi:MAG: enoyl-CoA hydratase-related protein [Alphaproteobacteria bacterium]|nr:enoyl-CoA hydratase-related protein [Alphaproteobacteria bacterium]
MTDGLTASNHDTLAVDAPADHVLRIELNRPDRRNAFNTRMAEELVALWDEIASTDRHDFRCIVLSGAGEKAFCSGADLKERNGMDKAAWQHQHALFERMSYGLMQCPIPVIAAVEGAAFAGGFELMLGCSFVYASENARFALTEVTLGLIPGIGGTQLLPRVAGRARALEILLSGTPFDAQQAHDWGIVNRLCRPGTTKAEALESAKRIAANAPLSVQQVLKAARNATDMDLSTGLAYELECYNTLVDTEDRQEGIRAFNEKRPPRFIGR